MSLKFRNILYILFLLLSKPCLADTTRINTLNKLGWTLMYSNPDTAILLGNQALDLIEKIIAMELSDISNPPQADKEIASLSLAMTRAKAKTYSNMGVYYWIKADYPKALDFNFKSLNLAEKIGEKKLIASILGNIGVVYRRQEDYPNALEYYFRALKMAEELGHKQLQANTLGNIGSIYRNQGYFNKALDYHFNALKLAEKLGNKKNVSVILGNIGNVYQELAGGDSVTSDRSDSLYNMALAYQLKALKIAEELINKSGMTIIMGNIAAIYIESAAAEKNYADIQYKYNEAEEYLIKALAIDTAIGLLNHASNTHEQLSNLYSKTKRYKLAYEHYKAHSEAQDTIFNEEKSKDIGRLEQKHEFEMAEIEREKVESEKLKVESEKIKRRDLLQYSAILISIFLFFGITLLMGKFNVPVWVVEASVFMLFLLIFEFTLVLLDPYIEAWTGGAPAYKLLINAALAGLVFPVHGLCEGLLKKRIMRNKKL